MKKSRRNPQSQEPQEPMDASLGDWVKIGTDCCSQWPNYKNEPWADVDINVAQVKGKPGALTVSVEMHHVCGIAECMVKIRITNHFDRINGEPIGGMVVRIPNEGSSTFNCDPGSNRNVTLSWGQWSQSPPDRRPHWICDRGLWLDD